MAMNMQNTTPGIYPVLGGFTKGTLPALTIISAPKLRGSGKSTLNYYYGTQYTNNFCQEIMFHMKPEPKYKFSRKYWYVAQFSWDQQTEVLEWCTKQFGPQPKNPDAWSRWLQRWYEIHFRDEKDYLMFMLRWSE